MSLTITQTSHSGVAAGGKVRCLWYLPFILWNKINTTQLPTSSSFSCTTRHKGRTNFDIYVFTDFLAWFPREIRPMQCHGKCQRRWRKGRDLSVYVWCLVVPPAVLFPSISWWLWKVLSGRFGKEYNDWWIEECHRSHSEML